MKQILLVTDGCSNTGMDPVAAASAAAAEGIVVNVVGVIGNRDIDRRGVREIEEIARAGGGMSRIVPTAQLSQTVQMMTRQTVTHTIHQVVNRELRQIMGAAAPFATGRSTHASVAAATAREPALAAQDASLESLHPNQRAEVVQVIDDLSEESSLKVALLIDSSASMRPKLEAVRETTRDLMLSLEARTGRSELALFRYPGDRTNVALELDWTDNLAKTDELFYKLNMRGTTPTGPAIMGVVDYIVTGDLHADDERDQADEYRAYND